MPKLRGPLPPVSAGLPPKPSDSPGAELTTVRPSGYNVTPPVTSTGSFREEVQKRMGVEGTTRKAALTGAAAALGGTPSSRVQKRLERVNKRGGLSRRQARRQTRRNKYMGLKAVPNTAPALTKKEAV